MLFSERHGFKEPRKIIQKESMDAALINGLWNCLLTEQLYFQEFYLFKEPRLKSLAVSLWSNYFKNTLDSIPEKCDVLIDSLKKYFYSSPWYEKYDFIEFIIKNEETEYKKRDLTQECNKILEREMSAFRIIENQIVSITEEQEIISIESALNDKSIDSSTKEHLINALEKLSDRVNPDYRNSIKESISAVEGICNILVPGDSSKTLGKCINQLKNEKDIHPSLLEGLSKIYGYTSDFGGIRHASTDGKKVDFDDAKLMLVLCSAFVNYLIGKLGKTS